MPTIHRLAFKLSASPKRHVHIIACRSLLETWHELRLEEHVDLVIPVTHMRLEEDIQVANAFDRECDPSSRIDLILGGHDHEFMVEGNYQQGRANCFERDVRIVKSGTDFRSYSIVKMSISRCDLTSNLNGIPIEHVPDLHLPRYPQEDPAMLGIDRVSAVSNQSLLVTLCPLEGRGSYIRNFESNLGNVLADAVRAYYDVDIVFVNSGSIRCDRVIEAGVLTDAIDILLFDNVLLVKRIPAMNLLPAMENSVSDSRTDSRFLQLSGMSVCADLDRAEGSRILSITLNRRPGKVITHLSTVSESDFTVSVDSIHWR